MALTVQGQTVTEAPTGGLGLALTCPDGSRYDCLPQMGSNLDPR